jgi:hypothetical protein
MWFTARSQKQPRGEARAHTGALPSNPPNLSAPACDSVRAIATVAGRDWPATTLGVVSTRFFPGKAIDPATVTYKDYLAASHQGMLDINATMHKALKDDPKLGTQRQGICFEVDDSDQQRPGRRRAVRSVRHLAPELVPL